MSLTPKNWATFQHYKDRAPAWIKLHKGLLNDFTFSRLPVASRALAPLLWLLASEYEDGTITASHDEIAFRLHMTADDFLVAVKPLITSGFFSDASGLLADCKQTASPEKEGEKQEQIEEKENVSAVAKATRPASRFEEFWQERPRRKGDDPRKPAEDQFNRLVKSGEDPDAIIAGVKLARIAYAAEGKIGTEFVPQMQKWLRDRRYRDCADAAKPEAPADDGLIDVTDEAALSAWDAYGRAKNGKTFPRDKRGGWRFPTKFPPGYVPHETTHDPPKISMQAI